MSVLVEGAARWAVPLLCLLVPLYGATRRVPVYEAFVEGAEEGLRTAVAMAPFLVTILAALGIFRESGALDLLVRGLGPLTFRLGLPAEILPLLLLRPLTGAGALAYTTEILRTQGPDSFLGRLACTVQGSTDTTFFVLTVYFGSVGVRRARHAVAAGLLGDLAGFVAAILVCRAVFA